MVRAAIGNIANHEKQAGVESSDDYYSLWQQTLEQFIDERIEHSQR